MFDVFAAILVIGFVNEIGIFDDSAKSFSSVIGIAVDETKS